MIRVNLLRKDQRLPIEPGGGSAFISGREVLLAGTFLVLGGLILWFVLGNSSDPVIEIAANATVTGAEPSEPAVEPTFAAAGRDEATPGAAPLVPAVVPPAPLDAGQISASAGAVSTNVVTKAEVSVKLEDTSPQRAAVPPSPEAQARSSILSSHSTAAAPLKPVSPPDSGVQPAAGSSQTGGVNTLHELRIEHTGNNLQILAVSDRAPQYKMFRMDNPGRIVIDLPAVRLDVSRENREQDISHSLVRGLRIAQNQIEPPMVRLVLEVSSFPDVQLLPRSDGLQINISAKP